MYNLQVVDVDADSDDLAVWMLTGEDVGVGIVERVETLLLEPLEEQPAKNLAATMVTVRCVARGEAVMIVNA